MNNVLKPDFALAATDEGKEKIKQVEQAMLRMPQVPIETWHVLHGGVYSRTIFMPKGMALTNAEIKISTTVTISGDVLIYNGDDKIRIEGYRVMPGMRGRKQAFVALDDTWITAAFATQALTVYEAEEEFTDFAAALMSRQQDSINHFVMTGE